MDLKENLILVSKVVFLVSIKNKKRECVNLVLSLWSSVVYWKEYGY